MVGEDVLVTGAGPIGVMAAAIVRHAGAQHVVVTDLSDYRLGLGRGRRCRPVRERRHATRIADAQRALGMLEGFDIGLEMSGAPSAVDRDAGEPQPRREGRDARPAARTYPIDWGRVITHMITIKGIYGREMFETWYLMSSMLATSAAFADAVRSVITHRFPAEEWAQAFDTARSGQCGKVILDWE